MELVHEAVVVVVGDALREAGDHLDVRLQAALQQLVHLAVVVVVVPDAEHAVDVVPDGVPERGRVHALVLAHPADDGGTSAPSTNTRHTTCQRRAKW